MDYKIIALQKKYKEIKTSICTVVYVLNLVNKYSSEVGEMKPIEDVQKKNKGKEKNKYVE